MALANSRTRYGSVAMTLHWLIALAIIFNICLGLYLPDLDVILASNDPTQFELVQLHKSVGLTVLALSLLRLAWRLVNPIPPLPSSMSPQLKFVARLTHVLLYVLMIGIPLSGWAYVSASPLGLPTMWFHAFQWPHIPYLAELSRAQKKSVDPQLFAVHSFLATSAIVLIPIHVAGALYHQFIRRDDVLKRMLPGTKVSKVT